MYIEINKIIKEVYKKSEIEIMYDDKYFWINRRDLGIESDYKNWAVLLIQKKQKYRCELIHNAEIQPCRLFVRNDLVERKIKSRTVSWKKV